MCEAKGIGTGTGQLAPKRYSFLAPEISGNRALLDSGLAKLGNAPFFEGVGLGADRSICGEGKDARSPDSCLKLS